MAALVHDAVNANAEAILGYVPEIMWMNTQQDTPDGSKLWLRFSTQTVDDGQATLSSDESAPGKKRYDVSGLVFVQLFCPRSVQTSGEDGRNIGEMIRNAFRGKVTPNCVWFRNARLQDGIAPEDLYYRYNVVAEFHYSDVF